MINEKREFYMELLKRIFIPVMLFLTFAFGILYATSVKADGWERGERYERHWDDDDHRGRYEEHDDDDDDHGSWRRGSSAFALPENEVYTEECSACHFQYQPWLLPARSWEKLMEGSGDHFGDDLALDESTRAEILRYLVDNSAENTAVRNEWTGARGKIMRSLNGAAPTSIRDVPYIRHEHRKLQRKGVFDRPSVGTFSNCGACHRTGAEGDYEEDNIRIPR